MKYLTILLLLLNISGYAQIRVGDLLKDKDYGPIELNAAEVANLTGKWMLVESVGVAHDSVQARVMRGYIIDFTTRGNIIESNCIECSSSMEGQWKILEQQHLYISFSRATNDYLAGEWKVLTLTDEEMILVKAFSKPGDWKRYQIFTRSLSQPTTTEGYDPCINCAGDGSWCFGYQYRGAEEFWARVTDLMVNEEKTLDHTAEIEKGIDWLLINAPCLNNALYVMAINFYDRLLAVEKKKNIKDGYRRKLDQIKQQQKQYFNI